MNQGHYSTKSIWSTLGEAEGMSDTVWCVIPFPFPQPRSENSLLSIHTLAFPLSRKDAAGGMADAWLVTGSWAPSQRSHRLLQPCQHCSQTPSLQPGDQPQLGSGHSSKAVRLPTPSPPAHEIFWAVNLSKQKTVPLDNLRASSFLASVFMLQQCF